MGALHTTVMTGHQPIVDLILKTKLGSEACPCSIRTQRSTGARKLTRNQVFETPVLLGAGAVPRGPAWVMLSLGCPVVEIWGDAFDVLCRGQIPQRQSTLRVRD